MATDPQRMASGTMLFVPPNGANIVQAGQIIPGTVIQPEGLIQYAGQPLRPPYQNLQTGVLEKMLRVETKTLGAIQIMIGLTHIGFGAVAFILSTSGHHYHHHYISMAAIGGYPFWGGLSFIISGSLSVAIEKHLTKSLVKCSVGMNITSAIMALTGMILYIVELLINMLDLDDVGTDSVGNGIGVLLLFFSLLEFCITVSTTHFGCQVTCCNNDPAAMVFVPYTVSGGVIFDEANPSPPAYEAVSPK
ncbi:membrane-spanning 4-domains subfamily A member 12-like [Eublepharis macularius]|uniref:Membrane-spanning 4-domains subfamily A member 12-like n=1 Tax=Eublepharis macularius TaxID=481883 RepID=A0AA97IVH6_EUBMA|nr:membrane-spanning 4-domains subfamily A member 12-like [Eublepharis macularius]